MVATGNVTGRAELFQITVMGILNDGWAVWFEGMTLTQERSTGGELVTTLTGPVADQAALRGLLAKIWDLNLTVISVQLLGHRHEGSDRVTTTEGKGI